MGCKKGDGETPFLGGGFAPAFAPEKHFPRTGGLGGVRWRPLRAEKTTSGRTFSYMTFVFITDVSEVMACAATDRLLVSMTDMKFDQH